jgi:glycosyltransferase involved in cell wall biosynthesis
VEPNEERTLESRKLDASIVISVVVAVYNEEESVPAFLEAVVPHLDHLSITWEIVFVNDGSSDGTLDRIVDRAAEEPRLRIIDLSRNFGKEAALTAGLDNVRGDAVIVMDVDLQDPPELIGKMVGKWEEGYDVVYAKRIFRPSDSLLKRTSATTFYIIYNRISDTEAPANVSDYRLMDRRVVEALSSLHERVRFMKGLFAWVGFQSTVIEFQRPPRHTGKSKFNFWKLWNFALDGVTSFSTVPLRIWSYLGLCIALLSFAYALWIIARTLAFGVDVPGYASILTALLFLGGLQLIGIGILGEYIGRTYLETKQRPIYLVKRRYGYHDESVAVHTKHEYEKRH